jgi:Ca-activated chloride channel homolog
MTRLRLVLVGPIFALTAFVSCSGSKQQEPIAPPPADERGPLVMAKDCPVVPAGPVVDPPHVFTPAPHPAHAYPNYTPPPPLDTLPRLVVGNRCTPGGKAMETMRPVAAAPKPVATRPTWSAAAGKPSGQVLAARGRAAEAKRVAPPAAVAAPRAAAAPAAEAARSAGPASPAPAGATPRAAAPAPAEKRSIPSFSQGGDVAASAPRAEQTSAQIAIEPPPESDPCPEPPPAPSTAVPEPPDPYTDWGSATYLSNDDTMSLSSAQRIAYAIDRFLPLPLEHVRPHELLNYFSFDSSPVALENDFSVLPALAKNTGKNGLHTLALTVQGRRVSLASRRNVVLTLLVDRSGSMKDEGRMEYLKRGLLRMTRELKTGDIVHLVTFNTTVCVSLESFVVGRDNIQILEKAIRAIQPQGNTDLYSGLMRGYELADSAYQQTYTNRVLLITDALANTGRTDPELMAIASKHYDARRVRLSGIGVGRDFNDRLLDRLTERGKGAYVFLGSEREVDAVFGSRFVSLIETIALSTHFRLHLPPSLRLNAFYGEEASTFKADVQPVHYFAGTSQLFLADVMAKRGELRENDWFELEIEYEHPDTGAKNVEQYAFRLGAIASDNRSSAHKGRLIMKFAEGLGWMAQRSTPLRAGTTVGSWKDDEAAWECYQRRDELRSMAGAFSSDPEVQRVLGLWDTFCTRFATPRSPRSAPAQGWPGAQPTR